MIIRTEVWNSAPYLCWTKTSFYTAFGVNFWTSPISWRRCSMRMPTIELLSSCRVCKSKRSNFRKRRWKRAETSVSCGKVLQMRKKVRSQWLSSKRSLPSKPPTCAIFGEWQMKSTKRLRSTMRSRRRLARELPLQHLEATRKRRRCIGITPPMQGGLKVEIGQKLIKHLPLFSLLRR